MFAKFGQFDGTSFQSCRLKRKEKSFFGSFPSYFSLCIGYKWQETQPSVIFQHFSHFHAARAEVPFLNADVEGGRALGKLGACLQKSGGNPHLNISSLCTEVPNVPKYFFLVCFPNTRLLMPKQVPYDDPAHGHWSGHSAGASTDIIEILEADLAAGNLATDRRDPRHYLLACLGNITCTVAATCMCHDSVCVQYRTPLCVVFVRWTKTFFSAIEMRGLVFTHKYEHSKRNPRRVSLKKHVLDNYGGPYFPQECPLGGGLPLAFSADLSRYLPRIE